MLIVYIYIYIYIYIHMYIHAYKQLNMSLDKYTHKFDTLLARRGQDGVRSQLRLAPAPLVLGAVLMCVFTYIYI